MIRRDDSKTFCARVPLGILPVGNNNFMAKSLFPGNEDKKHSNVILMADATMSVIRQLFRPVDVMEITNINDDDPKFHGRKLYGLRQIQVGAFRDSESRINNYWFLPGIKKFVTHVFSYTTAAKHIMWDITGTLETLILEESTQDPGSIQVTPVITPESKTWTEYAMSFLPGDRSATNERSTISSPNSVSGVVAKWQEPIECNATELTIQSDNDICLKKQKQNSKLTVSIGPQEMIFTDFVREGCRRQLNNSTHFVPPTQGHGDNGWRSYSDLLAVKWNLPSASQETEGSNLDDKSFYLDNETIEMHGGFEVTMLTDKLKMFCTEALHIPYTFIDGTQDNSQKKWWQRKSNIQSKSSFVSTDNLNVIK